MNKDRVPESSRFTLVATLPIFFDFFPSQLLKGIGTQLLFIGSQYICFSHLQTERVETPTKQTAATAPHISSFKNGIHKIPEKTTKLILNNKNL